MGNGTTDDDSRACGWGRYGVLTAGTLHEIPLCAAIRRYTRSPIQPTPGSQSRGATQQVAGKTYGHQQAGALGQPGLGRPFPNHHHG
jgi:hypothetical protein